MRIYLAAPFTTQDRMRGIRDVLSTFGHEVTSSWIDLAEIGEATDFDPDHCASHAASDTADLLRADAVAVFTEYGPSTTGGMHVETGIALAAGKRIFLVGPRRNIFHTLPKVEHFPDWPRLVMALTPSRFAAAAVSE